MSDYDCPLAAFLCTDDSTYTLCLAHSSLILMSISVLMADPFRLTQKGKGTALLAVERVIPCLTIVCW